VVLEKERTMTTDEPFGTQYALYQQQVPMFFPKREDWKRFLSPAGFGKKNRNPTIRKAYP
jgi:hypothetical protein